jgi:hypothetical protein
MIGAEPSDNHRHFPLRPLTQTRYPYHREVVHMPRGGKRPGAGAPKGNMNALKNGAYSKQFAQIGALFASDPKIREALLALAHKHDLRRHKANEVAALLFTRLFQRAEDIAARKPAHPEALEGFQRAEAIANASDSPSPAHRRGGQGVRDRLNLQLPADDLDTIKAAGALAAVRQIRSAIRGRARKQKSPRHNQTPDTSVGHLSKRGTSYTEPHYGRFLGDQHPARRHARRHHARAHL